jgi:photosystem II stability/assembly factor-like uncharacterized protein
MFRRLALLVLVLTMYSVALAQQYDPALYGGMKWRMIGPFRGGRTVAVDGIPDQPNVFFIGVNNGGVWKTTDYGHTWQPIFEEQPTQSVGALAVAPSDPNTIYVGSGEGLRRPDLSTGDGIYKTTDGGKNWAHLGLRDAQQIGAILVDPQDTNRVFVAALGHPYGPNAERGVFRSTDGGQTWKKVLFKDQDTGAIDLAFAPGSAASQRQAGRDVRPYAIYSVMWASRRPPWTVGNAYDAPGSGLYKSSDGGDTWQQIGRGLPTWENGKLGRIGIAIAPSDANRMYAMVDSPTLGGVYRSDDAGESWTRTNSEERVWGRGSDFAWVRVDPTNKDRIYVANTSTYRSTDGGATFTAIKGAPGGDDYHSIWINPKNPDIMLLGADQGATISVNVNSAHPTWSSWYNQPTAQFYHVITDDQFPYWVYGAQQESGSIGIASRADYGEITFRDWTTIGVEEYGYAAPDPLDANIVYGGKATRWDRRTHQVQDISPAPIRSGKYRFNRTAPIIFSTVDKHALYLGSNVLFKTTNGGHSWEIISPDLTRPRNSPPASLGKFVEQDPAKGVHGGVIYSIGPSFQDANTIWIGTDDGLIQVTRDGGKTWQNVTPPEMTEWSKVAQLEASHFDNQSAYAAVNRFRVDDLKPYIYRTHDGGKTWQKIVSGIPDGASVNTVREDPQRKGLLICGTENGVWVSFDDGDHWQTLQGNLPKTSVRDLVIHGDDVVVGTHGRSFWILDDITPLRQMSDQVRSAPAFLFKPQEAVRVRRSTNTDTPFPPEEPHGQNPPDGAIINYSLGTGARGPVTLEILDASGRDVLRRYSSQDKPEPVDPKELNVPTYWVRQPRVLESGAGMHRWVWDLREAPPESVEHEYPISAIVGDTPRYPLGASVAAGHYWVRLTAGGEAQEQPLVVKMDPRVTTPAWAVEQQWLFERKITAAMNQSYDALQQVKALRAQIKGKDALKEVDTRAAEFEGVARRRGGGEHFAGINGSLAGLLGAIDGADAAPTVQQTQAVDGLLQTLSRLMTEWKGLRAEAQQKIR